MRRIFSLMLMGGRAEGLACADPEARTTIDDFLPLYLTIYRPCSQEQMCPEETPGINSILYSTTVQNYDLLLLLKVKPIGSVLQK